MTAEENKRMFTLSCIVADLKTENMELEQRVHQLLDDYNDVARQLNGKEERKDKDQLKQTIVVLRQMREQCEYLKRKNKELDHFATAIHYFMKDKNIYMRKGTSCEYKQGNPPVCSTACLECSSCLGVIEGHGVICEQRLAEACAVFPSYGLQRTL